MNLLTRVWRWLWYGTPLQEPEHLSQAWLKEHVYRTGTQSRDN